ncbi:hypothetical protein PYW08_000962 [Mythimna loreyi]|uniref:Uncharacterized protein n=1 Tax=Mythimna loreyi TaxID=667449 RepID=A0ACC2QZ09_9NEOP|nr:hypothetical protein PYW08_000962 [Mythimna loreyi]
MSSVYENTVSDFDLDFLNQLATNNAEPDLQARADRLRKSILFLKRRVKYVDGYVSAFYAADKKVEEYKVIETQLKDQCKQHHVEIGSFIEKLTRLENELQLSEARERQKDEKISDLENQIVAVQTLQTQLKLLEIEKNKTPVKVVKKTGKSVNTNNVNKELESLRKENEKLHKENIRIASLEKEIENLRETDAVSTLEKINDNSDIAKIQKLEKEIERLCKENAKVSQLKNEVEILNEKNAELHTLKKDNENLQNENAKIPKLTEQIENLQKESAKIKRLTKEIEILRKENAEITNLRKENEKISKQNVEISNLQKEIENLRVKNEKLEMETIALKNEIVKFSNKEKDSETVLTQITSTAKETGILQQKKNKFTRKYKSLPDDTSEWWDHSEAENGLFEDPMRSPTPNDTIVENSPIANKDIVVRRNSDNDYNNEVASVDTGRGSSLANSDSDKGLNSPEFVLNYIPPNENSIENKDKSKDATITSNSNKSKDATKDLFTITSNSIVLEETNTSAVSTVEHDKNQNVCKTKMVSHRKSRTKSVSTVNQTNTVREVSKSVDSSDNVTTKKQAQGERVKECLEMNNSLRCDSHTDQELGLIFNTMKLNYKAVSPIPRTPVRMYEVDSTFSASELKRKKDRCNILCKEAGVFLMQLSLRLDVDPNSVTISDCDRLIACFESILKSKQVLPDCPISNVTSNMEPSDCILSHDDHSLVPISYPESSEKETEILQNNQRENRLSQDESWSSVRDENQNRMSRFDEKLKMKTISNPLPPNRHKPKEKTLQCTDTSMDQSQILDHSVSEEFTMKNKISEVTDSIRRDDQSPIENSSEKKAKKVKITKLGQLKKDLKPKYKIRIEKAPPRKLKSNKLKQLFNTKTNVGNETSASLNRKDVYEKAVKVMAELNSKQSAKAKTPKHTKGLMSPERTACLEKDVNTNGDNQIVKNCSMATKRKLSELFDTCTVVIIKDPLLFSPTKTKNSTNHKAVEDNNSTVHRMPGDSKIVTETSKETKTDTTDRVIVDIDSTSQTRSETVAKDSTTHKTKEVNDTTSQQTKEDNSSNTHTEAEAQNSESSELPRKRRRRSSNEPLIQYKRVLRSATARLSMDDNNEQSKSTGESDTKPIIGPISNENDTQLNSENNYQCRQHDQHNKTVVSYEDLDAFSENIQQEKAVEKGRGENTEAKTCHPKDSTLCYMLEKYGVETVRPHEKKIPDNIVKQICEKLEQDITVIAETKDNKNVMNNFVEDLRKINYKHFVAGLIKFLAKPERKDELFGKVNSHPAPPMTKAEQILLFAIHQLESCWPTVDIVDVILSSIEFSLFKLNRTPDFAVIESTSHFYAVLCRYVKAKSRLRLFMLDAMYCIQFKSVPLIKQCLEVWMHIIPLSHLGMAKTPLVTCLVYLLHFYKCEDKFNRVNEIRKILREKYYYQITDWNEARILEMFKNSIKDLKDISIEKKMLRLALIILAKRQGPQWCQNNIIKNLLQPMIEKENVRNNVKEFCVSMIGPLMKPYPVDMKVHCEIAINQLMDILDRNPSPEMEEAAITSMMYINRHDQRSINKTLLTRKMKPMSLALEKSIRDYVKTKPLRVWKNNLSSLTR